MKKIILICLLSLIGLNLFALEKKSVKKAVLMSAILPGTGQLYLHSNTKAGIFLASDLVIISSFLRFGKERSIAIDNYQSLANSQAGLRLDANNELYNLAQKYKSSEIYNNELEMSARNYYYLLNNDYQAYIDYVNTNKIPDENAWNWTEDKHFQKYKDLREDKQTYEIYQNFALGAIIINRLISVVDAAISANKLNNNSQIYTVPHFEGKGLTLIYEYKF
ncbi:MAG: DUF5683 domain-containing protein [Candidatus Cloacimonetes bacterium]|jgi:hypothetical protein|nr:DUF5683 domain-containing protein [Candidatus Cloacimonadota bacterium]MDD4155721.1 DUF5683 domain-containing protein [Candidatus Cloacimonadota bacterium]